MKIDVNDEQHKKVCWRCGHPKNESQEVCDHCKEAIDFTLEISKKQSRKESKI